MNLYARRRRVNQIALTIAMLAAAFGLFWLVAMLWTLLYNGISAINLDLFNALNKSTILTANAAYALTNNVWDAPTLITNPRMLKVSLTLDLR